MTLAAWRQFAALFGGTRRLIATGLATAVAQSAMLVPIALLVREAFDDAIPESDTGKLVAIGAMIAALYFGSAALGLWARHAVLRAVKQAITRLRQDLAAKLYRLPRSWFDARDSGTLHSTIVQDTERLDEVGNAVAAELLPGVVVGSALGVALLWLNPLLFVLLLATGPLMVVMNKTIGHATRGRTREWQEAFDRFSAETAQALRTVTLTKAHAAEEAELERRERTIAGLGEAGRRMALLRNAYTILGGAVGATASVVVLVVGGAAVARGDMTLGDLLSFYALVALMRMQASAILTSYPRVISGHESLIRLRELLEDEQAEPYTGGREIDFGGAIALERVSFGYGAEPVLHEVSLGVEPGEWVALLGPNGAGKSTIVNLILGLYRPRQGRVLADGVPLDELDVRALRRRIGVVLQDPPLFPGSVRDNIAFGEPDVSDSAVKRAAVAATAAAFIEELPLGYETPVGDEGELLSGGQRQRIAIARAMLREPRLLILDEPSSSLDRQATEALLRNLRSLPESPAVLLVTHDDVVARAAERTIAIRDGRIVEERSEALL